jgi:hypothetical protein
MKKYFWISLAFLISFSFNTAFAQKKPKKSKEEVALEKEWAKKLKLLKPLDYKALVDEKEGIVGEMAECKRKLSEVDYYRSEVEKKDAEIAKLRKELEDYNSGMTPGVVQKTTTTSTTTGGLNTKRGATPGVTYKVQLGSFKTKDLTKYFDNNPNFSGEVDSDGTKKYTIGVFTDYWEADTFKKALRDMGVKGAWVVPYKDGQRVNIKDVLEGTL